ncbi:SDR family oxidoreductase [Candidatus Gottesmanbacteria bacterium]|nr:SDR family oxidoreductase [Candidatus Gottesmanbacteria bacterium]
MFILVAGGAGFLGSWLCDLLIKDGHRVLCVDNLLSGRKINIEHLIYHKNFTFWQDDINSGTFVKKTAKLKTIDEIYHLASPASPNKNSPKSYMQYPIETLLVNSQGTYHLLELAKLKMAKFLYASSSEIYGEPLEHPQKETYFGNVNPNGPRSCYDEGKRFGEAMTFSYFRKYHTDARIVRIFNTYGPRMDVQDGRVVSNFIVSAIKNNPITVYGSGKQTRSFCYVSDLVDGLVKAMATEKTAGKVFNLGNDGEFSILELVEIIEKLLGTKLSRNFLPLAADDPTRRRPDLTRARELLSYNPKISLEEGLIKTIDYFKKTS